MDPLAGGVEFEGGAARALRYWLSAPSASRKLSGYIMSAEKIVRWDENQSSRAHVD